MSTSPVSTKLLAGLFDRPINIRQAGTGSTPVPGNSVAPGTTPSQAVPVAQPNEDAPCSPLDDPTCIVGTCPPGYAFDLFGDCVPFNNSPVGSGNGGSTSSGGGTEQDNIYNNITNAINITDTGIQQVAQQVSNAIDQAAQEASDIAKNTAAQVGKGIQNIGTNIGNSINAAFGNLGSTLSTLAQTIWDHIKDIFATIGSSLTDFLTNIKGFLQPILQNITTVVNAINAQVQAINDTLIKPIATLYQSTVGTISTLTAAIEQDLHQGLSGILAIPGQIADGLGSLDATLNRTVQQLGATNQATSQSNIKFAGETLPQPFGDAFAKSLGGTVTTNQLKTTFNSNVPLSAETLQQVSSEAISGIGTLLVEFTNILIGTFKQTFDQLHTDWTSVGSLFTGLLDGLLGLLTTVTAIGALAKPLTDAALQAANSLVPTAKLDPATVVAAMQRGFLDSSTGLTELRYSGFDSTRSQVIQDLATFIADTDKALDWWYRGIIADSDLAANMTAHGIEDADQTAIKAASVNLPSIDDLLRWKNFGLITQDQFTANAKILRYDDAQITAILQTYQGRIPPAMRAEMEGLLNNSTIGWFNNTSKLPQSTGYQTACSQGGIADDYAQFIWLNHWQIPPVEEFIEAYFRGFRTLTEVQARMAMANIPQELWADVIATKRALLPLRSMAAYVKAGAMTQAQAVAEIAAHGFDQTHVNILTKYLFPSTNSTTATAASTTHTLSITNARTLWADGGLSDAQYTQILESHGYTADMAAAQLKADAINEKIKEQKQTLADYTAEVLNGTIDIDTASQQLTLQGFTSAQVAKFQVGVAKQQRANTKLPSIADLKAFLKAGIITIDDFKQDLQLIGWVDPWLSYFVALETPTTPTATGA